MSKNMKNPLFDLSQIQQFGDVFPELTPDQLEMAMLFALGLSKKEIAAVCDVSSETIDAMLNTIKLMRESAMHKSSLPLEKALSRSHMACSLYDCIIDRVDAEDVSPAMRYLLFAARGINYELNSLLTDVKEVPHV